MESLFLVAVFILVLAGATEAMLATHRARRRHHMDFEEGP
jgi:hypothetical protein